MKRLILKLNFDRDKLTRAGALTQLAKQILETDTEELQTGITIAANGILCGITETTPEGVSPVPPKFLTEWDTKDFVYIKNRIAKYFKLIGANDGERWHFPKTYNECDQLFGLAYTSSGYCACLTICNINAFHDIDKKYRFVDFVMDANKIGYATLQDRDGNELFISI